MELPQAFQHLMHPKTEQKEVFLSLLLDVDAVIAAFWEIDAKRSPLIHGVAIKDVVSDSWDSRLEAVDTAISSLERKGDTATTKVILGLPGTYLTQMGDIQKDVRSHLKKLTHALGLDPMGFVSVYQAIIHHLKRDEGVPPTVILLGVTGGTLTVSVYKIGSLVGQKIVEKTTDVVGSLEEILKSFHELEVLPSRILVYGTHTDRLEDVKGELLRHPWQTRANFMHFPKIDVILTDTLIAAISFAGASELALSMEREEPEEEKPSFVPLGGTTADTSAGEEESNVVMVDPERLGFRRNVDVLEEESKKPTVSYKGDISQEEISSPVKRKITFPHISIPRIPLPILQFRIPRFGPAVIVINIMLLLVAGSGYWMIPHATVTIYEVPKKVTKTIVLTIDPTATVADSTSKILPGKKQEKTINGEKTMPVTGKKQIGDPAKGAVTITNRTFDSLTLPKGTVFTSGDLQFTLDNNVSIASASAVKLTTNTGAITANVIGAKSNLASGTIFTIKGYSLSEAAAQNDQALSGGTSKDVAVVSRIDQDNLVKALTTELVDKAKQDLTSSVSGTEQLIDTTIKTSVVDKTFVEELDQEAKELHGKATIAVSGISYNKTDLVSLLSGTLGDDLPSGYTFDPKYTNVTLSDTQVKKDGKVTATAQLSGVAIPQLDLPRITQALAGKTMGAAQEYLKSINGVGAAAFRFQLSLFKNLPINKHNISVTVAVQE